MKDLISREAAIKACEDWMDRAGIRGLYRLGLIISIKYIAPANQLRAKWVRNDAGFPACSNCGKVDMICDDAGECFFKPPYCMWCGAKMDED